MTKRVVKVLVAVAAAVTIVVGIGTMWGWLTSPRANLEAAFSVGSYVEPPSIDIAVGEIDGAVSRLEGDIVDVLSNGEFLLPDVSSFQLSNAIRRVTHDLEDRRRSLLRRRTSAGYLSGVVTNSGSTTLENVRISVPGAVEGEFSVNGHGRVVQSEGNNIPVLILGTLAPGVEVQVSVWTRSAISRFRSQEIRLSHSNGFGDVSVEIPTGRLGQWVERWGPGLLALTGLVAWLVVMSSPVSLRRQSPNRPSHNGSD